MHAPANASTSSGAGRAHVAADEHPVGAGERGRSRPEGVRDLGVELVGHRPRMSYALTICIEH